MTKEKKENLSPDLKKHINIIYKDIFSKFKEQYIVVFLCGGVSNKKNKSLRDRTRVLLENEKKYVWKKPFKVFYPEDLLIEVLNRTKEADLLSYEQFLANNSHVIVIICESAGSLVELGAFTNNSYTVGKVIASVDKKRIKDKSFIMLGPIKYLKKLNKFNVVEYSSNINDFSIRLKKSIREKKRETSESKNMIDISTIVGMHYFIQLILYFYKQLNSKELSEIAKYISEREGVKESDFKLLFNAALKLLFQDKQIIKITGQQFASYKLTQKGFFSVEKMISDCAVSEKCDKIRVEIMYNMFYKLPRS